MYNHQASDYVYGGFFYMHNLINTRSTRVRELPCVGNVQLPNRFDNMGDSSTNSAEETDHVTLSEEEIISILDLDSIYCSGDIPKIYTNTDASSQSFYSGLNMSESVSMQSLIQRAHSSSQQPNTYQCGEITVLPELSGDLFFESCNSSRSSDQDYCSSEWLKEYLGRLVSSDIDDADVADIEAPNPLDERTDSFDEYLCDMVSKYLGDTCIDSLKLCSFFDLETNSSDCDNIHTALSNDSVAASVGSPCAFVKKRTRDFSAENKSHSCSDANAVTDRTSVTKDGGKSDLPPVTFAEKYKSFWNPKSAMVYYYCPYGSIMRDASFYDGEFEGCVLEEIKDFYSKRNSGLYKALTATVNDARPQFVVPDLTLTFSNTKGYILDRVSEYALADKNPEDVAITEGMSISDIREYMVSSADLFLKKLDGYCNDLANDVKNRDIVEILQTKIKVNINGVLHTADMRNRKLNSERLLQGTKRMMTRYAAALKGDFRSAVLSASNISIKSWLFSHCHNVYFCNKSLKNISKVCLRIHRRILENKVLVSNLDVIAKRIVNCDAADSSSIVRLHNLTENNFMKRICVSSYITNLSQESIVEIRSVLKEALVLCNEKVSHLNNRSLEKMAGYLVRDIETVSIGEYKKLCDDRSKKMISKNSKEKGKS